MAEIVLTNQKEYADNVEPQIQDFRDQLEVRKDIWNKLGQEKQRSWIENQKDPVIDSAWRMYEYLHDSFFGGLK